MDFERLSRFAGMQKPISDYIPFSSLVEDDVVLCRDGSLIATWAIEGIGFETSSTRALHQAADSINRYLISIAKSNVAVQVHRVRRHFHDSLEPIAGAGFAADFSRKYNAVIGAKALMATEIYLTLIYGDARAKPSGWKGAAKLLHLSSPSFEAESAHLRERLREFRNMCGQLEAAISEYRACRLGTFRGNAQKGEPDMSDLLSFYNYLVTGDWSPVRLPDGPLNLAMGNCQVFWKRDMLQLQTAAGSRFMQSLELKDYPDRTTAGMLDNLLYRDQSYSKNYEFIEAQTFALMNRQDGQRALELQRRQLIASEDKAVNQVQMLDFAQQGLINGDFAMGEYSYSLLVFGDTEADCRENTRDAAEKLRKSGSGFLPFVSTLTCAPAYLSAWPTNLRWRPRIAKITSANFAALAPFHNFIPGKRDGNPWGEALALLPQPSDQPYYLNLHSSPRYRNSFGKPYAGNTVVLGSTGVGKTAFISFLATMALKYREPGRKFSIVFFDKDHGAEILVRALGGTYLAVENGRPTGFNPFSLPPSEENIQFLIAFIHLLLKRDGRPVTAVDEEKIAAAVRAVMSMDRPRRSLSTFMQNITAGATREEKEKSVARRLAQWYGDGAYAWVFDNTADAVDLESSAVCGIDGTDFLDNPAVKTPIAFYLLYRVEQILDGRRLIFVMDEFWKWLADEAFRQFAYDQLKTIRKKNALMLLATQSPAEILKNEIARAVVEQTSTQIFLPNPQADRSDYVDGFKVTPEEFSIISTLRTDSRAMLVKQNGASSLAILNLASFEDELNVLSSTTENIEIMHAVIAAMTEALGPEAGQDPGTWLPVFYEAVRENRTNARTAGPGAADRRADRTGRAA